MNEHHMLKPALFLLISSVWCLASPAYCRSAHAARELSVKQMLQGPVISADVVAEPLDNLLRDLGSRCDVHITCRGDCRTLQPVSIQFHDLPLKQAINKLLRAAGINNHLIRYGGGVSGRQAITEVVVFGKRTMAAAALNPPRILPDEDRHELSLDRTPPVAPADAYSNKIASLKDRYRWQDEETRAWAGHLLEAMPDEVKDFGLDRIMKELDKAAEPEGAAAVNTEIFYRAIEAAAPPGVAPAMMRQVIKVSERYHERTAEETSDPSCEGLRQKGLDEGRQ
jgi:hypothetical protein